MTDSPTILPGDCIEQMRALPDACVQCCVTSPPYFGLRDYRVDGQIGLEKSPAEYVAKMAEVFREVRRLLKPDGTCWINLGDSYCSLKGAAKNPGDRVGPSGCFHTPHKDAGVVPLRRPNQSEGARWGLKSKDLIGIPWRVAFALQADGWWLRQDIIWHKPNPMPESVTDRCTKAHEYIFLLTKSARYFYDADAIRIEPSAALLKQIEEGYNGHSTKDFAGNKAQNASDVKSRIIAGHRKRTIPENWHGSEFHDGKNLLTHPNVGKKRPMRRSDLVGYGLTRGTGNPSCFHPNGANKRSVWSVPSAAFNGCHFATFPPALIRPCVLAGSRPGDTVLDPFAGSGTTGRVALELGRRALLIELNPSYLELIRERCAVTPGLKL